MKELWGYNVDDADCCLCGDPLVDNLFTELPDGDRVHSHCEENYWRVAGEQHDEDMVG